MARKRKRERALVTVISAEDLASVMGTSNQNNISSTRLTKKVVTEDLRSNRHNPSYRGEYESHPYQSPEPVMPTHSPSPLLSNGPLILPDHPIPNQMDQLGATQNNPSWETIRTEREARNQADIASAVFKAHYISKNNRPKSTKFAYNSKQNIWKSWCTERGFEDLDTVSAGKLILWLQDNIIPNGVQHNGARRGAMLTESGLEGYVKPIIALYEVI
jgi:hypothetical protein